ncbi:MAG: GIY-YIG nuclease family protein [Anaerotignum sp.]|nr:GIY-YIG nuclease family protein [Anaerotignum sp.]
METTWYLYILRCKDSTLYTGITTDVEKRFQTHQSGKGAKYTRGRRPLELIYREQCGTHSDALKREWEVKQLSREKKQKLITRYTEQKETSL